MKQLRLYTHTHTHTSDFIENNRKNKLTNNQSNLVVCIKHATTGITLVALVVTIVVLLILAGITLTYVMGDNSVFNRASEAKLKTDIANWKEKLELAKGPVIIDGLGVFEPDKYFEYIQEQGIIEDKETDVVDNEDGTYDVTTKPGYIFQVELMPTKEKPVDIEIEYIGQAGKVMPIIKRIETSSTQNSITAKAIITRLGNGTVTYYYKPAEAEDSQYQEITNVNTEIGATQKTGITAGEKYTIKVVAKNEAGEATKTVEIAATKVLVESIILNKTKATVIKGKTLTLTATVEPEDATNKNVKWTSSNEDIATVSETGVITGKTEGTATITATATDGSNIEATCSVSVSTPTVADIVGEKQEASTTINDENGNKVVIPDGFRFLSHGTESSEVAKVEYNYDENHNPCVQDGIVIADDQNNQFVWIPVGQIKNLDGSISSITLGRYIFTKGKPAPASPVQSQANYGAAINTYKDSTGYGIQESINQGGANTHALNLKNFIDNTINDCGYWIARFEASNVSGVKSKYNKAPWTNIKQSDCSVQSRNMKKSGTYRSDLVNSYAWDTALVFIEKMGHTGYSGRSSKNTSKLNTGMSGDKVCNIYDLSSNCCEYSTETYTYNSSPCVWRGGTCRSSNTYAFSGYRTVTNTSGSTTPDKDYTTFRCILFKL